MAKNKLRTFNLDGISYLWRVTTIDPQYLLLKIWLDGNAYKSRPVHIRVRFDNPILNYGTLITVSRTEEGRRSIEESFVFRPLEPSMVREIILGVREAGWQPEVKQEQLHFEWVDDAHIEAVADATIPGEKPFG